MPEIPSVDLPPFVLVRVQDALHGAKMTAQGLRLPYERDGIHGEVRNTLHWAANAVVGDHAYGAFNKNRDGSLKGAVVILADPRDLPEPAGLGQVDTWFRLDAKERSDGTLERGLTVGPRATLVLPEGLEAPAGASVVRYDGTLAGRDAAVKAQLDQRGQRLEQAGMWSWLGGDTREWAKETVRTHYPEGAARIHINAHSASVDEAVERMSYVASLVERHASERLYEKVDGSQVPMSEMVQAAIGEQRQTLDTLLGALAPVELDRVGAFYQRQLKSLAVLEGENERVKDKWEQPSGALSPSEPPAPNEAIIMPPPLSATPQAWSTTPPPLTGMPPPLPEPAPPLVSDQILGVGVPSVLMMPWAPSALLSATQGADSRPRVQWGDGGAGLGERRQTANSKIEPIPGSHSKMTTFGK